MNGSTGRRGPRHIGPAVATLVATLGLAAPGGAEAASYEVHTCRLPDQVVAGTDGWIGGNYGPGTSFTNGCSTGGALTAQFDSAVVHNQGNYAGMTFFAPDDTVIVHATLDRDVAAGPDRNFGNPVAELTSGDQVLESCMARSGCTSRTGTASFDVAEGTRVRAMISCLGGGADCPAGDTHYTIRRAAFTLRDTFVPTLATPTGSLMSADTLDAVRSLSFSAEDRGGGVYRARLVVDGEARAPQVVDANGGTCAAPFTTRVPCALKASGTVELDTRALGDGAHQVALDVRDATDDNRALHGPWPILVDNLPPTVGTPVVSGRARVGEALTATAAVEGQTPTVTYQWLRARADGSDASEIAGATGRSYTLTAADEGRKVLVRVTAADHGGAASQTSSATDGPFAGGATVEGAAPRATTTTQTTTTTPTTTTPTTTASAVNPDDPAAVPVANPLEGSGTNGHPPADDAILSVHLGPRSADRVVVPYGTRRTITGTITTNDGRPIAGAQVFLTRRLAGTRVWKVVGSTASLGDGTLRLSTGRATRPAEFKVVYFPRAGSDVNRASNPLSVVVRQDARLYVSRSRLHNGQLLRFGGYVRGALSRGGARLQLQVQLPSGWYTFRRLSVRRGRVTFVAAYRFRRTTSPTRYRFRIRVLPASGSPYAIGYSGTRSVVVIP